MVDPHKQPQDGNLVLVVFNNTNEATVRKYTLDGEKIKLLGVQDEVASSVFNPQKIKILGTIVQSRCYFEYY